MMDTSGPECGMGFVWLNHHQILTVVHYPVQSKAKARVRDMIWIRVRDVIIISQMRSWRPRDMTDLPEPGRRDEGGEHEKAGFGSG